MQRFIEEIVPRAKEIKEPCPDLRLWRLFISVESSRLLLVQISGNRFLLSVSPGKRDDNRLYLRLYNIPSSLHYFSLLNRSMSTNDPSARFAFRWWMDRARRSILTTEFESSIKFNVEIEDRFLISYTFNEISVVSLGSVRDVVLLEEEEEELVWNFLRLVIGWKEKFLNLNFPIFSMIFFDILSSLNRYFTGKEEIHAEVNIFVRFGDSIFRNVKIWYTKIRKVWRLVYRVTSDSRRREMEMRSAVAFLSLFIQCEFKFEVL